MEKLKVVLVIAGFAVVVIISACFLMEVFENNVYIY